MDIQNTSIEGLLILSPRVHTDDRGLFQKPFASNMYSQANLETDFAEEFYSVSKKNVVRGMHFQIPPHDHTKIVYCVGGRVLDVVCDLRKSSATYGKVFSIELGREDGKVLYIPKGLAHGFLSLTEESILVYKVSSLYHPASDQGVLWSSLDFNWPVDHPIVSPRDAAMQHLKDFKSPFI